MDFLADLGIADGNPGAYDGQWRDTKGEALESTNPATGEPIATVRQATREDYDACVEAAREAFLRWRAEPAPRRGELVRRMGNAIRERKDPLGRLITLEMGKILQEGWGEVQEVIDIADFAVGQSRQLYGLSMHSERPAHAMREQWHPLGPVGVITAFNFPMAVWGWNAMIAWICGDACVWKPSPATPLSAIAMTNAVRPVLEEEGLGALASLCIGPVEEVATPMLEDRRVPLVSFTGSIPVGRKVAATVAGRLGRTILELGGNNAVVVMDDADLDLAVPAIVFGAVGTAGQRCTTTRRLLLHESIAGEVERRLVPAYEQVRIGDPMEASTLCGPVISSETVENVRRAIEDVKRDGGELLYGGERLDLEGRLAGGNYLRPAIARVPGNVGRVCEETFGPLLYVMRFRDLDEAIEKQNGVPQGFSSSILTQSVRSAERFLSASGSDCGIANVNIGTSGAEIGGAFGGEKDTGGGREAGSDAWKAYMRRQTNTINWSTELPLAQGIRFG